MIQKYHQLNKLFLKRKVYSTAIFGWKFYRKSFRHLKNFVMILFIYLSERQSIRERTSVHWHTAQMATTNRAEEPGGLPRAGKGPSPASFPGTSTGGCIRGRAKQALQDEITSTSIAHHTQIFSPKRNCKCSKA